MKHSEINPGTMHELNETVHEDDICEDTQDTVIIDEEEVQELE